MASNGRKCVFCRTRPADTKEHALPLWTQPYLDQKGGATFVHQYMDPEGEPVREWSGDNLAIEVKRVCGSCNNGWMSDLETAVEPFLGSLLKGNGRTLYKGGQNLIACWSIKTALMWEFAMPKQVLPSRWFSELYEGRADHRVPEGIQIWIGACVSSWGGHFKSVPLELNKPSGERANGYGITFNIGRLIVQIFGHEFGHDGALRHIRPGTPLERTILPIWPYAKPAQMPPYFVLGEAQVEKLAAEFVGSA